MEEQKEILEIVISHENKHYRYKFNEMQVESAELAREIGEFKALQIQSPPNTLNELIRSEGMDFLFYIGAYLFRELKDVVITDGLVTGEAIPFSRNNAETKIMPIIKQLPVSEIAKIKDACTDFFRNIGLGQTALVLFQRQKSLRENLIYSMLTEMKLNEILNKKESLETA